MQHSRRIWIHWLSRVAFLFGSTGILTTTCPFGKSAQHRWAVPARVGGELWQRNQRLDSTNLRNFNNRPVASELGERGGSAVNASLRSFGRLLPRWPPAMAQVGQPPPFHSCIT